MGTVYYISPNGSDTQAGTSPGLAWQTLTQVNSFPFQPGDSILLEGGETFAGSLAFAAPRLGTPDHPIYIGSFGQGRAIINAGNEAGIHVQNGAGFEIADLHIIGSGRASNPHSGISFLTDQINPNRLDSIYIHDVEVEGFNGGGISITADENLATLGYSRVGITDVVAHDNGDHGIYVTGTVLSTGYSHKEVYIARCTAYGNPGQIGKDDAHTGNGIVVSCTEGAMIEYCLAYGNGGENTYSGGGPVGIWLWDTKDGVIQFCESHHNQTSSKDGGGFDLDGGCINSVLQYNYSHDNDGAGILLAAYPNARPLRNCTVRFNISENDGRANSYGSIMLWRHSSAILSNIRIYHNVVYISEASNGSQAWAFQSISSGIDSILVANNIFFTYGNARTAYLSHGPSQGTHVDFVNNCYYNPNGSLYLWDQGSLFTSLTNWRNARGQELLNGNPTGVETAPLLTDPGNGGTLGDPFLLPSLSAYELQATSPLLQQGVDLNSVFNLDPGPHDFFLNPLGNYPADIGAHAYNSGSLPLQFPGPDPASEEINLRMIPIDLNHWQISLSESGPQWLYLRVISLNGQEIVQQTLGEDKKIPLDLTQASPGVYLIQLFGDRQTWQRKLMVD